ncbi:MAG: hypothetical protein ACLP8S_30540 [Solirubrobacteraceae bacterium]
MSRIEPPSGAIPPETFELADGATVDLGPLARQLCEEYFALYPDDLERYSPAGGAWCEHDSRYLLAWALEDARAGTVDCVEQVKWLGRVLAARSFPIERLAAHVQLTATVLHAPELGETGVRAADRMSHAATVLTNASAS